MNITHNKGYLKLYIREYLWSYCDSLYQLISFLIMKFNQIVFFFFLSSNNKSNNKGTNKLWGNKSGEKFDMVYTLEIILKHIEKN